MLCQEDWAGIYLTNQEHSQAPSIKGHSYIWLPSAGRCSHGDRLRVKNVVVKPFTRQQLLTQVNEIMKFNSEA